MAAEDVISAGCQAAWQAAREHDRRMKEIAAISSLAEGYGELLLLPPDESGPTDGVPSIDIQSEEGHRACEEFLSRMEAAAEAMWLHIAPRGFRADFSVNYRALFPDGRRHYRVDVLEASIDRYQVVWVNGDKFELTRETIGHAEEVQRSLADLFGILGMHQESVEYSMTMQDWIDAGRNLSKALVIARDGKLKHSLRKVISEKATSAKGGELAIARHSCSAVAEDDFPIDIKIVLQDQERQYPTEVLGAALTRVDVAWAAFEHKYIANLIIIEESSRQLVVRAVESERRLRHIENAKSRGWAVTAAEIAEANRSLVECVSRLNAVANHRRKGRDDLGGDILESALVALSYHSRGDCEGKKKSAAQVLAADIVGAFDAIREYLRDVKTCLERVDPHLCNNPGLAARLVDWEESWEVGGRYVRHAPLLDALCDLVAKIQGIQRLTPSLTTMCEECDVELFLVLPRVALLAFLAHPTGKQVELMRVMLPHRFSAGARAGDYCPDAELEKLVQQFHHAMCMLASAAAPDFVESAVLADPSMPPARAVAWEMLLRRAVNGCEGEAWTFHRFAPSRRSEAKAVSESFCRALERWSCELQRHCPQDWNQCSAVLVQCLTGASKRHKFERGVKFQV